MRMPRAATLMASRPEAHRRLTVAAGTLGGSPASSAAIRATLRLSSPAWFAQPRITSSISSGSRPGLRSSSALSGIAARSSARTAASAPPWRPIGVRTASQMSALFILRQCIAMWAPRAGIVASATRKRLGFPATAAFRAAGRVSDVACVQARRLAAGSAGRIRMVVRRTSARPRIRRPIRRRSMRRAIPWACRPKRSTRCSPSRREDRSRTRATAWCSRTASDSCPTGRVATTTSTPCARRAHPIAARGASSRVAIRPKSTTTPMITTGRFAGWSGRDESDASCRK